MNEQDRRYVSEFFYNAPTCLTDGMNDAVVSYLAVKRDSQFVVIAARIELGGDPNANGSPLPLVTPNVKAGSFALSRVCLTAQDFVAAVVDRNEFPIPGEVLLFPPGANGHGAWFQPLDPIGLHANQRVSFLRIFGAPKNGIVVRPHFDWELKAAAKPYDGVDDLAEEFKFSGFDESTFTLEVVADPALEVHSSSFVEGRRAQITIQSRYVIKRDLVSLNVRVISAGQVVERSSYGSDEIHWSDVPGALSRMVMIIEVPRGATVHCIAVYDGRAQHQRFIVDQSATQNKLREVFSSFDPGLTKLQQFLDSGGPSRTNARLAESSFAWTLTMLGFQVFHLGGVEQTQDAADIAACAPSGGIFLLECTTGALRLDKLANLVSRTEQLKKALERANFEGASVIPILATTWPQDEIAPSIDSAERNGVLVMSREHIDEWVQLSAALPDPDAVFQRKALQLRDVRERYASGAQSG